VQRCPDSTRYEVEQLAADGITPTLDELASMMHWGALVECPAGQVGPCAEDAPIELGGRVLWPLTMQADAWLDAIKPRLPVALHVAAYGYAAEYGREPGAFAGLYVYATAAAAVRCWAAELPATADELTRAIARLVPDVRPEDNEPPRKGDEPPILPAALDLAPLVAATGLPLEYWQTHTSRHYLAVLRTIAAQRAAEAGERPDDASKEAYRQLLFVVAQIRRRVEGKCSKS
jgi:hypothetical protein